MNWYRADKFAKEEEKQDAHEKYDSQKIWKKLLNTQLIIKRFVEIQQTYERLSEIKKKRKIHSVEMD